MSELIYPFKERYLITSTFADHVNAGPPRSDFPGPDYGTPMRTEILAMADDVWLDTYIDGLGNPYLVQVMPDGQRRFDFLHVDEVINPRRKVKQGEVVGYTGNKGYTTGPHCHITYRPDWVNSGICVDCAGLLTSLPLWEEQKQVTAASNEWEANQNKLLNELADARVKVKAAEQAQVVLTQKVKDLEAKAVKHYQVNFELTEQDKQTAKKATDNIVTITLKHFHTLVEKLPEPLRPILYLVCGIVMTTIAVSISGIDWNAFAAAYPSYAFIGPIMLAGAGDLIVYYLKKLGGELKDEAALAVA